MISVSLNAENTRLARNTFLQDALNLWGYRDAKIAVAINQEFVPKSQYATTTLNDGDLVDIVKPVGGG